MTEQEMVDAIKMKGVNYAQAQTSNKTISHITSERENHEIDSQKKETGVTEIISSCAYSPEHACQFIINNSTDRDTNAIEIYSIKGENTFDQYERDLYSSPKWEPEYDLPLDKFPTPSNTLGSAYYDLYKTLHDDLGFSFLPDKINKCYTGFAEYADGDSLRYIQQVSFYFNEKKLVKVVTDSCIFSTETGYSLSTANGVLTYQNIEPDEMPEVNDVVLDYDATSGSIPALFNTEGFTVDTKNEFNFIINSSLCTTAT
ncbi:MAG: hypothetical protein MJ233_04750 [Mycoplasmoidaceae bacterium]|nr:hypothetical protein [Mycoplasmoidaceae bacterium]